MTIYAHSLKKEDWFSIAKCIDNYFAPSRATFTADRLFTYYMLTTNACDSCSIVKVYFTNDGFIAKIVRVDDDTDDCIALQKEIGEYYRKVKSMSKGIRAKYQALYSIVEGMKYMIEKQNQS